MVHYYYVRAVTDKMHKYFGLVIKWINRMDNRIDNLKYIASLYHNNFDDTLTVVR